MSVAVVFNESCCEAINQLVQTIKPSRESVERRYGVQEYVRKIIGRCFAPEQVDAYMFGSVPLRTYLPDGDIDLSVVCSQEVAQSMRDTWALKLQSVIEQEQSSGSAPFRIGDVTVINAEVKLLKCLVDNIVVDISCNQIGGLVTLNFLEEINSLIGNSNIFKRSIILVKAWCYYESRLLGAHHGLISTYALETLVLYVFNKYHDSIDSPLTVLYNFLVEFSSFDWDHYCLSLLGPVPLKDLPKLDVDAALAPQRTLLQCDHRLADSLARFRSEMASSRADLGSRAFVIRCLNIMDPLLPNNNLGRSVVRSSFARIRRAFGHGAALLRCLAGKDQSAALADLKKMFRNTWFALEKHGPALSEQQQQRQQEQHQSLQVAASAPGPLQPHLQDRGQPMQQEQQQLQQQQPPRRLDQQQEQLQYADTAKQQHQQLVAAQALRQRQPLLSQHQLGQMLLEACHAARISLDALLCSPSKQQVWVLVQYLRQSMVSATLQQQQQLAMYQQSRQSVPASVPQQQQPHDQLQQDMGAAAEVTAIKGSHSTDDDDAAAFPGALSAAVSGSNSSGTSSSTAAKAVSSNAAESTAVAAAHRAIANLAMPRTASTSNAQPRLAASTESQTATVEHKRQVDTPANASPADDSIILAASGQQAQGKDDSLALTAGIGQPEYLLQNSELSAAAGAVDFSRVKAAVLAADGALTGAAGLPGLQNFSSSEEPQQQPPLAAEVAIQQQPDPSQLLQPGQVLILQQLLQLVDCLAKSAVAQQQQLKQWQRSHPSQRSASVPPVLNSATSEALAAIAAAATAAMHTAGLVSTVGTLDVHPSQQTHMSAARNLERSASTGHSVSAAGQQDSAVHAAAHAAALAVVHQQQTAAVFASKALTHPTVAYPLDSQSTSNVTSVSEDHLQQLQQQHALLVQQQQQQQHERLVRFQDVLQGDLQQLTYNLQMAKAYMFKKPFPGQTLQQQAAGLPLPPSMISSCSGQTLAGAQQQPAANTASRAPTQLEQQLRTLAALSATANGLPPGLLSPHDLGNQQQQQRQAALLLQQQQLLHRTQEQQVAYSVVQAGFPTACVEAEAVVTDNAVVHRQVQQSVPRPGNEAAEEVQALTSEQQQEAQAAGRMLLSSAEAVAAQEVELDTAVGAKAAVAPSPVKYTPPHRRTSQLGAGVGQASAAGSNSTHAQDTATGANEVSTQPQSQQRDQHWSVTAQATATVAGSAADDSKVAVGDIPAHMAPIRTVSSTAGATGIAGNSPLANSSSSASVAAATGTLDTETDADGTAVAPAVPAALIARAATPRTPLSAKAAPFVSRFAPVNALSPSAALQALAQMPDAAVVGAAAGVASDATASMLEQPVQAEHSPSVLSQSGNQQCQQPILHPQVLAARQQSIACGSSSSQLHSPQVSASSYDTAENAHFESTPGTPGSLLEQHSSQGAVAGDDHLTFARGKPTLSSGSEASSAGSHGVGVLDQSTAVTSAPIRTSGTPEGPEMDTVASAAMRGSANAVDVNSVQQLLQPAAQSLSRGPGALQAQQAATAASDHSSSSTSSRTAARTVDPSLAGPKALQVMNYSEASVGSELSAGSDEPNRRVHRNESVNSRLGLDMELTDDIYTPSNESLQSHDGEGVHVDDTGRPAAAERGDNINRYQHGDREASSGVYCSRPSGSSQQQHLPPPASVKHEQQQQQQQPVQQEPMPLTWVPLEPTSALGGSAPHLLMDSRVALGGSGQSLSSHSSMPTMYQYQQHQEQPAAAARSYGSQTPKKPKLSTTVIPSADSPRRGSTSPRTSLAVTMHPRQQPGSAAGPASAFVPVVSASGRVAPVASPYTQAAAAAQPASPQPVSARQQLLQAASGGGTGRKGGDINFVVGTVTPGTAGAAAGTYKSGLGVNPLSVSSLSNVAAESATVTAGMGNAIPPGAFRQPAAAVRPHTLEQAGEARQAPSGLPQDAVGPAPTAVVEQRYQAGTSLGVADNALDPGFRISNAAGESSTAHTIAPGTGVVTPAALQHAVAMQYVSLQAAVAMGMMPQDVAQQQIAAAVQAMKLSTAAAAGAGQMSGAPWLEGAPAVPMFMGVPHSAAVPPSGLSQQQQQQESRGDGHGMIPSNSSSIGSSAGKYHASVSNAYMAQGPRSGLMAHDRQSSGPSGTGQGQQAAAASPRDAASAVSSERLGSVPGAHSGAAAGNVPGTLPVTSSPHQQMPPLLATMLNPMSSNMGPFSPVPFPGPAAFMSHAGLMAPLMFPMMPGTFTAGPPVHPTGMSRAGSAGGVPGNAAATAQRSGSGRLSSSSLGAMGHVDVAVSQQEAGRPGSQAGQHNPASQGPNRQNNSYPKEQQQRMEHHAREEQLPAEYHKTQQHYNGEQQYHQRQYREQHRNELYRDQQHQHHHAPGRHFAGGGSPYGAGHNTPQDSYPPPGFVTRRGGQQSRYSGSDSGSSVGHHPPNLSNVSGRRNSQGSEPGAPSAVYQHQQASSASHRSLHQQQKQQPASSRQAHAAAEPQQQPFPDATGTAVSPSVAGGVPSRAATSSPSSKSPSGTGVYVPGAAALLPDQQQQQLSASDHAQQALHVATSARVSSADAAHTRHPSSKGRGQLQPQQLLSDAQAGRASASSGVLQSLELHVEGHASHQQQQQQQHGSRSDSVDNSAPALAGGNGQEGLTAMPAANFQGKLQPDAPPSGAPHRHKQQQQPVDHSSSSAADAVSQARGVASASLTPGRPRVPVATVVSLVQATQEDRERQSRQKERRIAAAAAAAAALGSRAHHERADQQQQRDTALLKAQQLSDSAYATVQQNSSIAQEFMQQDAGGDTLQALPLHMSRLRSAATASSGYSVTSSNCSSGAGTPRAGSSAGGDATGEGGERRRSRSVGVTPGLSRLFTQAVHRAVEHRATDDSLQSPMHAASGGGSGGASGSSASSSVIQQHEQPSQQQSTQPKPGQQQPQQQVAPQKLSDSAAGSGGGSSKVGGPGSGTSVGSKRGAAAISSSRAADERPGSGSGEGAQQQRSGPALAAAAAIAAALGGGAGSRRLTGKRGSRDDLVQQQQQQPFEPHAGSNSSREVKTAGSRAAASSQQDGAASSLAGGKSEQGHHQQRGSRAPPVSVSPPLDDVDMFPSLPTSSAASAAAGAASKGWVAPRPGGSSANSSRRASADGAMISSSSSARYNKPEGSNAGSIISDGKGGRPHRGRGYHRSDSSTSLHSLTHSSSQQELSSLGGAGRSSSRGRHHRASSQSERKLNQEFQLADEDFPTLGASVAATGKSAGGALSRQSSASRLVAGSSRTGSRQGFQEGEA